MPSGRNLILWLVGDIEFWTVLIFVLLILVPIEAAFLFVVVVHWTGTRSATMIEKALEREDDQKHHDPHV